MKIIACYCRAVLKTRLVYQASVMFSVLGSILAILAQMALWRYLYEGNEEQTGYMLAYVVLASIIGFVYYGNIAKDIEGRIRTGDLAMDLIKPASSLALFWGIAEGNVLAKLILQGIPILLVFSFTFAGRGIQPGGILLFVIALLMGHILFTLIYICLGYLAFVTIAVWPYLRLVNDTIRFLSGSVVPLSLIHISRGR